MLGNRSARKGGSWSSFVSLAGPVKGKTHFGGPKEPFPLEALDACTRGPAPYRCPVAARRGRCRSRRRAAGRAGGRRCHGRGDVSARRRVPLSPWVTRPCASPLPAPSSPTPCLGVLNAGEGDDPGTVWDKPGAGRAQWRCPPLVYSRGAAGLGVLLATPHLQEIQHVLGQLLVVVQHTLPCRSAPPKKNCPQKPPPAGTLPECKAPGPAGAAPALWASSWGPGEGGSRGPCRSS